MSPLGFPFSELRVIGIALHSAVEKLSAIGFRIAINGKKNAADFRSSQERLELAFSHE